LYAICRRESRSENSPPGPRDPNPAGRRTEVTGAPNGHDGVVDDPAGCAIMLVTAIRWNTMPPEVSTDLDAFLTAHASLLAWLHAQSSAAHWGVSRQEFAAALHRSAAHHFGGAPPVGDTLEVFLRGLHLEDLAMACALRRGSEQAWEEFVARYRPVLYAAARAIVSPAGEARARDLADSLYADLYGLKTTGADERRPLLDYFHGRSKLATWLRAVLAQRHVDALRASRRTTSLDDEEAGAAAVPVRAGAAAAACADPDRERLLPHLRDAVSRTLAGLAPSDRLLISLYYVEDLTLAQIALLRGVHEATASRHLERIRRELRESVERALAAGQSAQNGNRAHAGLSPAEIALCFTYALEDWPLDLRRELSQGAGRGESEEA
jgi:RNA polymerase sigma-70 factor